ncbi:hypothetical protein ABW19_dt0200234 [Dactylella cylindrospora]|nr:hypothetical protein ABW19_dt0200234 [Dactylella cylindrospora]
MLLQLDFHWKSLFIYLLCLIWKSQASNSTIQESPSAKILISSSPDFMRDSSSDALAELNSLKIAEDEVEPYIFFLRPEARWDTDAQQALEADFNKFTKKSAYDYVLRSEDLGTYFYTRNTTVEAAKKFGERHKAQILTISRYSEHVEDIRPKEAIIGPDIGSPKPRLRPLPSFSTNRPSLESIGMVVSEETDLMEMRVVGQARFEPLPTKYWYDNIDGGGVQIYVVGTGANIDHEAFAEPRQREQFSKPIFAGPNPAKNRRYDGDTEYHHGTRVLGKLIGNRTGLARYSTVTVVSDVDRDFQQGTPLALSALVQIYNRITSADSSDSADKIVINISWRLDRRKPEDMSLSERIIHWWLDEIMKQLGSKTNVIIVVPSGDAKKDSPWPASMSGIKNLVVVGGADNDGYKISKADNVWVYAPAANIFVPTYGTKDGKSRYEFSNDTAMAAAIGTGVIAQYLAKFPRISPGDTKRLLHFYAHPRGKGEEFGPIVWNGISKKEKEKGKTDPEIRSDITDTPEPTPTLTAGYGGPKPGYVFSTVGLDEDESPEPDVTVTAALPDVVTVSETSVLISVVTNVVVEMETTSQIATVTTVSTALPPEETGEYRNKKCFGIDKRKYVLREHAAKYIADTFCHALQGVPDGPEVNCNDDKLDKGTDGKLVVEECYFYQLAYEDTISELDIRVRWDRPGLKPSYETCVRSLRDEILDGCDVPQGDHFNVLNWKGGGSIDHGAEVHYHIEPRIFRKPWKNEKYIDCVINYRFIFSDVAVWGYGWQEDSRGTALHDAINHPGCGLHEWKWDWETEEPGGHEWRAYWRCRKVGCKGDVEKAIRRVYGTHKDCRGSELI